MAAWGGTNATGSSKTGDIRLGVWERSRRALDDSKVKREPIADHLDEVQVF